MGPRLRRQRTSRWLGSPRVGWYVVQPQGYAAFLPKGLPPTPPVKLGQPLLKACSETEKAISSLRLPSECDNNLLEERCKTPAEIRNRHARLDLLNYSRALSYGVSRITSTAPSMALLLEVHRILVADVPRERLPGQIRRTQNWVGGRYGPFGAAFIPPPPHYLCGALQNLDEFLAIGGLPACVEAAIGLAQLQLIHPFCNGNGRMGRILAILTLVSRGVTRAAFLPFEAYLRRHRMIYLRHISALPRSGDWESWIGFVLTALRNCTSGISQSSTGA
jgi:fido (protein-threonine AMPylation protein)